jgi:hypothetical protein
MATQLELYKYVRVQEAITSQLEISSLLMETAPHFLQFINPFALQWIVQADPSVCEGFEKRLKDRTVPCGEKRFSGLTLVASVS